MKETEQEDKRTTIKDWADDEKPREKLMSKGAESLADAELLAILIGSGTQKKTAVDLAREIMSKGKGTLDDVFRMSIAELMETKGIGAARAVTITAALELGKRRFQQAAFEGFVFRQSRDAANLLIPMMCDLNVEVFRVLYLNGAKRLLRNEAVTSGGITGTTLDYRVILKTALLLGATNLVLAHNHPSGSLIASPQDKELTRQLKDAANTMLIKLLDHLIIAGNSYMSMNDENMM